jgi:tetrahydromethanopterin S-methyltransferase subunit B
MEEDDESFDEFFDDESFYDLFDLEEEIDYLETLVEDEVEYEY